MKKGIDFIGVGAGALVFNKEGKVLLAQRGPKANNEAGKWDFPGGTVEFGETIEDTLKRELIEELGIEIEIRELLDVVNHILPEVGQHWISPSYIAIHLSGEGKILEPEKCTAFDWFYIKDIDPKQLTQSSLSNYEKYVEKFGLNHSYAI
jgi:8-oxo-dGTP diphosphatase